MSSDIFDDIGPKLSRSSCKGGRLQSDILCAY